jgi:hypothetical protein
MDKQIYIEDVPSIELGGQTYTTSDDSLIASFNTDVTYNTSTDYIEYFIYNANKELIDSVESLKSFAIYGTDLSISPEQDLENRAYLDGKYYTVYNFLRPLLSSSIQEPYYISQISTDRTEIRLASTNILGGDIVDSTVALKTAIEAAPFQKDFYLNFGSNNLIIANNILLDESDPSNVTVLIKLYEPLSEELDIQSQCWAVEKIAESKAYLINVTLSFAGEDNTLKIKGPNFNLQVSSETNKSTEYQTTSGLKNANNSNLTYQLNSVLAETGIDLNIDYSNYTNFIFFSSAQTRLENFYYKLGLIEEYTYSASFGSTSNNYYNSGSSNYWQNKLNETITNFDGYEYYLYFESGSNTWPKSNSTPPYTNYSTTSTEGLNWLVGQSAIAETYDENNKDGLVEAIPLYIKEDPNNANFELFVEMVGQHFDSIWVYTQAIPQKYNSDNRVESGLSKDLIGTALKDFGIKLYQNNFTSDNLYNTYLGYTPSGSLLPYTGQELITSYVTASATGSLIPLDNLSSEIYKRLYHNLPFLLKKKGTVEGLNTLITTFGIPDTILRVYEYGGKDQNTNTFDQWQQQYDLTFLNTGSSYVTSSFVLNSTWAATSNRPSAVEFKFMTPGTPSSTHYSQSLWSTNNGAAILLKYTGSAYSSGSYTGSIVSPYSQYGLLEFYPSSSDLNTTASIYLPFFDGGWWSILINKNSSTDFTLYAKNSLYNGNDGNTLGFQASSSVSLANPWATATEAYLGKSTIPSEIFSGSLQELRYYTQPISENTFDAYVMNPGSIEQSQYLAFRASLGGELYTASISIHPKVSGTQITTSSFSSDSFFYITGSANYVPNVTTVFYDQPTAGIKNAVSDKIRVQSTDVYGTTLSGLNTLQQTSPLNKSFTKDVNYIEVGFSPQNEINEDINSQFGYFNIGEYIGDPRFVSQSSYTYPALEQLSLDYFKKYTESYNYTDYLRLIKFFDNSLFKLLKDFIPARTSAATGAIIKQHLLERNRQRPAQVSYTQPEYTASVTSVARDYQTGSIGVFTGGPGGSVNALTFTSQSWSSSILTKAGLVNQINSSQYEFFNGAYSGSSIGVINNKLQDNPLLGSAYRVGIPDLQNLNVELSSDFNSGTITSGPITFPFGTFYSTGGGTYLPLPLNQVTAGPTYYNSGAYTYTPGYNVQADLVFNFSGSVTNTVGTYYFIQFTILENNVAIAGITLGPDYQDTGTEAFKNSITLSNYALKAGSVYSVYYRFGSSIGGATVNILDSANTNWTVTVDNLYALSTYYLDPTVYTQQNFPGDINNFSDYNSLLNNVYSNRVSDKYYDVDYSTNLLNPVNFQSIISESALYAQVQDSNYTSGSVWTKARYSGTKLTSATYNTYTAGDISYGETAVIDSYGDYIGYFDTIESSDPEYPGGGIVNLQYLIHTDGTVIGLTAANENLFLVENTFKAGSPATFLGQSYSSTNSTTAVPIIEGGASYRTILVKSGSRSGSPGTYADLAIAFENYPNGYSSGGQDTTYDTIYFATSSLNSTVLQDSGSAPAYTKGWLSMMLRPSSSVAGICTGFSPQDNQISIWNKYQSKYYNAFIPYEETFFPLRTYDYIRFGLTNPVNITASVDYSFSSFALYRIVSSSIGDVNDIASNLTLESTITGSFSANLPTTIGSVPQGFRIFRRVPDETKVTVSPLPGYLQNGILVPNNFNPNVDPLALARKVGLIT